MNRIERFTKPLMWFMALLLVALAAGAGCGGNGTAGVGGVGSASSSSTGVITGFGSVYVNGVEFNTAGTSVSIDGASGTEAQLKVGMVVKVDGTINGDGITGNAASIKFSSDVEGPISAKNTGANTLTVLGQTVIVDSATIFEGATGLSDPTLVVGNNIEVSGFRNTSGIVASRIEKKTAGKIQVKGTISNLDTGAHTFTLGALTVDYGSLNPLPTLSNGVLVEVKASTAAVPLIATRIEVEDTAEAEGHKVEVEGYISGFTNAANDFKVANQGVRVSANTIYETGAASDLNNGAKIEVEGVLTNGVLVAGKVSVKQSTAIRINIIVKAPVEAIDTNSITVLGQRFTFNKSTQMEDETGDQPKLNIGNISATIAVGDHVGVRGFKNSAGDLIATRIERNDDTKVLVQGPVEAVASPTTLKILGLNVTTSSATTFKTAGGEGSDAATFFGAVATGTIVKAEGTKTGTGSTAAITAVEVEIKNEIAE